MRQRLPEHVLDYFRKAGSRGGKQVAASMTQAQRTARASKGGKAAAAIRAQKKGKKKAPKP